MQFLYLVFFGLKVLFALNNPSSAKQLKWCIPQAEIKDNNSLNPVSCQNCKTGWDGQYCTRENIAYKKVNGSYPPLQDENDTSCVQLTKKGRVGCKVEYLNMSSFISDLFFEQGYQDMNSIDCKIENTQQDCTKLNSPLKNVIRYKCGKLVKKPRQLNIKCSSNSTQLTLCEVRVYKCEKFWFGVENGCSNPCDCQDEAMCGLGKCPEDKLQTTSVSPRKVASSSTASSTKTAHEHSRKALHGIVESHSTLQVTERIAAITTDESTAVKLSSIAEFSHFPFPAMSSSAYSPAPEVTEVEAFSVAAVTAPVSRTDKVLPVETTSSSPHSQKVSSHVTFRLAYSTKHRMSDTTAALSSLTTSKSESAWGISEVEPDEDDSDKNQNPSFKGGKQTLMKAGSGTQSTKDEIEILPIVVPLFVLVLVAVLLLVIIIVLRARRKRVSKQESLVAYEDTAEYDPENNQRDGSPINLEILNKASGQAESCTCSTEPISIETFRNHVSYMDRAGGYEKEFQDLPEGIQGSVTAAMEMNKGKVSSSCFEENVFPYDENRVILLKEQESDSDYINASYIDGFAESRDYIAAQGPLPTTLKDFWHMVWVEGCGKIVMLNNLCEETKVKCAKYWPELVGDSLTFGCYTITSIRSTEKAFFVHRVLGISKTAEQTAAGEVNRLVHQFHFNAWPDPGVPCPVILIHFWTFVNHQRPQLTGPMLVHCSDGIGRTGTYIALDLLSCQAEITKKLSLFSTVKRLRTQRVNMVQTVRQYQFLHEVLAEWLASKDCELVRENLLQGSQWTDDSGRENQLPAAIKENLSNQFQAFDDLRPVPTKNHAMTTTLEENVQSPQMLTVEQYHVQMETREGRTSDHINGIILPSLSRRKGYIVTQQPKENMLSDFWQMVYSLRIQILVQFMNAPKEQTMLLSPQEGKLTQRGPFSILTTGKSSSAAGLTLYTLQVSDSKTGEAAIHTISVYCVESPMALLLKNTTTFVSLVNTLLPFVTTTQPPILLQCFDGAGPSCVLCGLMMAAESLETEGRANPFLLIRLIQAARPLAFRTKEQYEFVVRCLLHRARGIKNLGETENTSNSVVGSSLKCL